MKNELPAKLTGFKGDITQKTLYGWGIFFFFFLLCVFIFTTHVTKKQNKSAKDIYYNTFENTNGVLNSFHPDSSRGHILAKPGLSSQDHGAILASLCRVSK